jgi:hypothetical protein
MRRRYRIAALGTLLVLAGFLVTLPLCAQSPIGDPILANAPARNQNDFTSQTILANGDLLVVWENALSFDEGPISILGRRFSLHHPPGELMTLATGVIAEEGLTNAFVAARAGDGFLLEYARDSRGDSSGCYAIAFGNDGHPLAGATKIVPNVGCGEGLIALADGTFATSWLDGGYSPNNRLRAYRIFARLSSVGELVSRPRRINPVPLQAGQSAFGASLAGNQKGEMTLVWDGYPASARFFNAYGGTLPPLAFVGTGFASAAVLPNGNRIFAGLNYSSRDINYVAYQRFAPDGTPLGRLRPAHTQRDALFGVPVLGADQAGNFVIAWGTQPTVFCDRLEARLFRADGTPVGKEFFASLGDECEGRPQVSFGTDGTFALSWVDPSGVSVAWFSASPADEPCLTRGGRLP